MAADEKVLVAVSGGAERARLALVAAAEHSGYGTAAPDDLVAWAGEPGRAVVLTVEDSGGRAELAALLHAVPSLPVVAVLAEPSPAAFHSVLLAGAGAAVATTAHPDTVARVLDAVVRGEQLRPPAALPADPDPAPAPA